jgi:hypothetical protein
MSADRLYSRISEEVVAESKSLSAQLFAMKQLSSHSEFVENALRLYIGIIKRHYGISGEQGIDSVFPDGRLKRGKRPQSDPWLRQAKNRHP